ncbi:MAG: outer membrane beta-barrel protein [Parafilimonas sp.]
MFFPCFLFAQIGIKTGVNFANVTNASSVSNSSRSGFLAGIFLAPKSKGILGFRTELIYSRQGYNYASNTNTGNVNLDYILLPQLTTINITKYFQLQLGAQMAFLINAKADSSSSGNNNSYGKLLSYYNRFDYGFAGGIEIHPYKGLLIGARYNISLGNLYSNIDSSSGTNPSFIPKVNTKNNVVNIFIGWRFGK